VSHVARTSDFAVQPAPVLEHHRDAVEPKHVHETLDNTGVRLSAYELLTEVEQGLARLTSVPALIVWGDRDQALREPQRLPLERTFPNHRTVILTGASHYIEEDAPDEIVAAIRDWWPGTSNT
jgi:pimeloyl-ACP methyl ester carboxylesterase